MIDLEVKTINPAALDQIAQQFGAVVGEMEGIAGAYEQIAPDTYLVRCYGDPGFLEFMITQQGYGTVVGRRTIDAPAPDDAGGEG
jgi:hypothetical protein